ncbi:MAG: virulence-associated E family protein [Coriobacteriia bacterium]|nr:virulence-associated E family protein [Coriobacteriia bacterium]
MNNNTLQDLQGAVLQDTDANPAQTSEFTQANNSKPHDLSLGVDKAKKMADTTTPYVQRFTLATNNKGAVAQTIANAKIILTEHEGLTGKIKWNVLSHAIVVAGTLPWNSNVKEREWDNADDSQLLAFMEMHGLTKEKSIVTALYNVAQESSYHPIADWLKSLKWDGKPRMATVLTKFLGCDDTSYTRAVATLFLFGAVARALTAGIKFDIVPILVGKQGAGKSLFLRKLAAAMQKYFCDTFANFEGTAASERLRGMWLVELSELLALKRTKDVEAFKSFLTSTVDVYRPPYGRRTEQRPRMAVFCGTTNDHDFLTDRSGNRRFLPLLCHPERVAEQDILQGWEQPEITEHLEQVWAEAYSRYVTEQPKLVLPKEIQAEALNQQEVYTEEDLLAGQIEHYLENRNPAIHGQYITAKEIATVALGIDNPTNRETNKIHAVLRAVADLEYVGKQKTHFGTIRAYCTTRKEGEAVAEIIAGSAVATSTATLL